MNLFKATIATAAVITCCLGNEYPARAFWIDECQIIRDQARQSQMMLAGAGAEMDRQAARDGLHGTTFKKDMLATDKAMYDGMLRASGCN